jgi:hypothetical protein
LGEAPDRCSKCGAELLYGCPSCEARIRGYYDVPGVVDLTGGYEPPQFCDKCGEPFPWLDRQGRIYLLENLLDDQDLDPADALTVREQLEALRSPEVSEDEAKRRWGRIKELAPGLLQQGKPIIDTVASAAIKAQLGI